MSRSTPTETEPASLSAVASRRSPGSPRKQAEQPALGVHKPRGCTGRRRLPASAPWRGRRSVRPTARRRLYRPICARRTRKRSPRPAGGDPGLRHRAPDRRPGIARQRPRLGPAIARALRTRCTARAGGIARDRILELTDRRSCWWMSKSSRISIASGRRTRRSRHALTRPRGDARGVADHRGGLVETLVAIAAWPMRSGSKPLRAAAGALDEVAMQRGRPFSVAALERGARTVTEPVARGRAARRHPIRALRAALRRAPPRGAAVCRADRRGARVPQPVAGVRLLGSAHSAVRAQVRLRNHGRARPK